MTRHHSTHAAVARTLFALVVAVVGALVLTSAALADAATGQQAKVQVAGGPAITAHAVPRSMPPKHIRALSSH